MTADDRKAIERLRAAAAAETLTAAPWAVHDGGRPDHTICQVVDKGLCDPLFERWDGNEDATDAEFIAAARTGVPALLRRVEELEEALRGYVYMPTAWVNCTQEDIAAVQRETKEKGEAALRESLEAKTYGVEPPQNRSGSKIMAQGDPEASERTEGV